MIYPTRSAVIVTAAGTPFALAFAAIEPGRWYLALVWPLTMLLLTGLDSIRATATGTASVEVPRNAYVGEIRDCSVTVSEATNVRTAWVALKTSPQVKLEADASARIALHGGRGSVLIPIEMARRGIAHFEKLWLRWTGPLGLAWHQRTVTLSANFPILPDLRLVHDKGARIFERYALEGMIAQLSRGEGSDFDTLVDYRTGMDRRSIDWKQSARHRKLVAKHYRTERNNQIVFALDTGRQMCEPIAGLARVDRCVSAILLTAWLALKLGDRIAINAFDSRPRLSSGFVSGGRAFAELERISAGIDYSSDETNYTFALTTLGARLNRRSMIFLFTEFTDTVSADFMLRAIRRLVEKHLVIVVVMKDQELETIENSKPLEADDITRAVTAGELIKDRQIVITRLQRLGIHVIECEYDKVGERLVEGYFNLKKRNLL